LNEQLVELYRVIEGADAPPTAQAAAAVSALERALDARLARWRELVGRFRSLTRTIQ
jgi:hypothetical protein